MSYLDRKIFDFSYKLAGRNEMELLNFCLLEEKKTYREKLDYQNEHLQKLIQYVFINIPYYRDLFKTLKLRPVDIKDKSDLHKLPVLTKSIIQENYKRFIPQIPYSRYFNCTTGGSTGQSLKYRCSDKCYSLGVALMYRGWGYAGYEIGDSVFMFGGGSIVKNKTSLRTKISYRVRNIHPHSSYGVSTDDFKELIEAFKRVNPKFIRGYASSVYLLARYIADNGGIDTLGIKPPKAIFTTAEMLYPNKRTFIESVFKRKVYNNYGLNDGGLSAYEGDEASGFLIDTERAIMECVDEERSNKLNIEGSLLATSLFNYDFPFIRYETGDLGIISDEYIRSGGNKLVLKDLLGRANDYLEVNGKVVGSPALTVLMGKVDVHGYQIIQKNDKLRIVIDKATSYNTKQEDVIRESLQSYLGTVDVTFDYSGDFIRSNNKHKFIIKEE